MATETTAPKVWELPHDVAINVLTSHYGMTAEQAEQHLALSNGYGGRDTEQVRTAGDVDAARRVVRAHLARKGAR